MNPALRKKRVWTVADFAAHAFNDDTEAACRRARRMLVRMNDKHGGKLLIPSEGTNRKYEFLRAVLARLEPDYFTPVESIELDIDTLKEETSALRADQRIIVGTVGQHTRDIEALKAQTKRNTRAIDQLQLKLIA